MPLATQVIDVTPLAACHFRSDHSRVDPLATKVGVAVIVHCWLDDAGGHRLRCVVVIRRAVDVDVLEWWVVDIDMLGRWVSCHVRGGGTDHRCRIEWGHYCRCARLLSVRW